MEQRQTQNWKFGAGQTGKQERAEMEAARAAGLEREYVDAQRWARMREAEAERKRAAKRQRATTSGALATARRPSETPDARASGGSNRVLPLGVLAQASAPSGRRAASHILAGETWGPAGGTCGEVDHHHGGGASQ